MGRRSRARLLASSRIAVAAACVALAVTGCGGGASATGSTGDAAAKTATNATSSTDAGKRSGGGEKAGGNPSSPSKAKQAGAPVAEVKLTVPGGLTTANTCKGANESPRLTWRNIPPGTAELVIFAVSLKPVKGTLYFDWALAGVNPSLSGLKAGEVPEGAVLGRTSAGKNGYSLCPKGSARENYIFTVYALTKRLSPKQGFDSLKLRTQATPVTKEVGFTNAFFPK
jgi:phosphatidylethanolamine-binding protein (PEBP) family uncharacterized protein